MLSSIIKRTAKKLTSGPCKGFFTIIDLKENSISFKNVHNVVMSLQVGPQIEDFYNLYPGCGLFQAGYVREGQVYALTYESEYTKMDFIDVAEFKPFIRQATDNPDFIKRTAMQITFN